ncbi:macro domain-containing protein [Mucilaginibacter litoreus]|uniref:Macro domain-containing protein n=1 Tax=Mucilaginibacter litoreus TaxID=1048221 RepID=A0ABW3AWR4_9SPHI
MKYIKGNLLDAPTEALVNTVNTVGVMGKGIALQFKLLYPHNFDVYSLACKNKLLVPGKVLVVKDRTKEGEKTIINFPTKTDWFRKSSYEYIESGLKDLVRVIRDSKIKSIAIPPLGCGNGGLNWGRVKSLIEKYLSEVADVEVLIYLPNDNVKQLLKNETAKNNVNLTASRAILLYSMFYYESLGESSSLFIANKLTYFLQRLGEKSFQKLKFEAHFYGPYSVQVEHMLQNMNGKYIKGLEQMQVTAFEPLELQYNTVDEISNYVKNELSIEQQEIVKQLIKLIDGYQSALSLEVLASIDFIKKQHPGIKKEEAINKIYQWSDRKRKLFQPKFIDIAWEHLSNYSQQFNFSL